MRIDWARAWCEFGFWKYVVCLAYNRWLDIRLKEVKYVTTGLLSGS